MGLTQSTQNYDNQYKNKQYTDSEIIKSLSEMFKNNKNNELTDGPLTEGIIFNMNESTENNISQQALNNDINQSGSGRKRYLRYNLDKIINRQTGGSKQSGSKQSGSKQKSTHGSRHATQNDQLSDFSEFEKIRKYILNDIKNNPQSGGNHLENISNNENTIDDENFDDIVNAMSSPNSPVAQQLTFFDALRSGGKRRKDNDNNFSGGDDEFSEKENDDKDSSSTTEDDENDEEDKSSSSSSSSEEGGAEGKKHHKKEEEHKEHKEVNEGGFSTTSSEINILPFYSSDSSSTNHPYMRNRFH